MLLDRFDPPGQLDELDEAQRRAWSQWISDQLDEAARGDPDRFLHDAPRAQFFNPTKREIGDDSQSVDIAWIAFPKQVATDAVSDRDRWELADSSRDLQDEYCEWSVQRDPNTRKITRVTFTCEGPEYWQFLANTSPEKALRLYQEFISPQVKMEDLFANGRYIVRNRWNSTTTNGAMHLVQVNNTLGAEIELAAGASIVRRIDGRELTQEQELIRCGKYGSPGRNSDPHIGSMANSVTRQKADLTLANPIGIYFADLLTAAWSTPDGSEPKSYWKYVRGTAKNPVRAVYEVPPERGFVVGDIRINDRPIEFGAQIADFINMKLTAIGCRFGQSTVPPMTACKEVRPVPVLEVARELSVSATLHEPASAFR